jgi:alkylated DNA nucleotide flippase Atl1
MREYNAMLRLTFEADTAADLESEVRSYLDRSGGAVATPLRKSPSSGSGRVEAHTPTNDDYRRAIQAIPSGKVAAYGTVSEVVRGNSDGSQHVAGLAANDVSLPTAYRVVKRDGSVAAGFRWGDGRRGGAEEGQGELEKEGVQFDTRGRALPEFVLSVEELRALYEAER